MRRARLKAQDSGFYHCLSRIIEKRRILNTQEKDKFLSLLRKMAGFSGIRILTYCILSSHWHVLLYVPKRQEISDEELIRRLAFLYDKAQVDLIEATLKDYRTQGQEAAAEDLKQRYTYRMYDVSQFFKTVKQRFSQYYNRKMDRSGPLWEQRFKSVLVEGSEHALSTIAAYIDLNPVRAGIVQDPKDYRYCGYAEALGGNSEAREGLKLILQSLDIQAPWSDVRDVYRQQLFIQGQEKGLDPEGKPINRGFTREQVEEVLRTGGKLPRHILLRCRIRYFSDGLAFGSRDFAEEQFDRNRDQFGPKRKSGARAMRYGNWGDLVTLRALRRHPVSVS